jgi:hypothetical protein
MQRITRFAHSATQFRSWRAVWILVSLGLVALGAAAPGDWGTP